jgi:hypothetical protein
MPTAYFVVRATVSDPTKRAAFDAWYSREHLPDASKSFGVTKAWLGPDLKRLVADFNRDWPDVTRTRETLVLAEEFGA